MEKIRLRCFHTDDIAQRERYVFNVYTNHSVIEDLRECLIVSVAEEILCEIDNYVRFPVILKTKTTQTKTNKILLFLPCKVIAPRVYVLS